MSEKKFILHWNHIHSRPFIHFFSVHTSDRHSDPSHYQLVYEEEPKLGYETQTPINLPLKGDTGPHQHHKVVKIEVEDKKVSL